MENFDLSYETLKLKVNELEYLIKAKNEYIDEMDIIHNKVEAERNVYKEIFNKYMLHPKTEQQQTTELSDFSKMLISENAELNKALEMYKNLYNDIIEKHNEKYIDARSRYEKALKAFTNVRIKKQINFPQPLLEEILKMAAGL